MLSCTPCAVIAPPVPAFYAKPQTITQMIDQTLGRVLDLFGLETGVVKRWGEPPGVDHREQTGVGTRAAKEAVEAYRSSRV